MSRLIIRIVVVLPQPDGPTNTTISPAGMSMLTVVHGRLRLAGVVLGQLGQPDRHPAGGLGAGGLPVSGLLGRRTLRHDSPSGW